MRNERFLGLVRRLLHHETRAIGRCEKCGTVVRANDNYVQRRGLLYHQPRCDTRGKV